MKRVYFDNAATTPVAEEVITHMTDLMRSVYGNPSSIHKEGREARTAIENARRTVANLIGASIGEIFFTSGGTESNNMALKCSVRDLGVERIITSQIEHPCVLKSLDDFKGKNIQIDFVDINAKGCINYAHLQTLLKDDSKKTLVSLMHCNNELGTLTDLEMVAEICEEAGVLFHTDTVQTMGYFPIDVSKTRINFLAAAAHKFHGPKGVGFIYINGDNMIQPYINGGSQERNMRAGTENLYGIAGLAKALEMTCEHREEHRTYVEGIRSYMIEQLNNTFPDIIFNGDFDGKYHYKTLSVSFPPSPKSELLLLNLDIAGISASGGSACSSGAEKSSHVMEAIGGAPGRKTVRFSFSHLNTKEEVDYVVGKLAAIVVPEKEVSA